MTEEFERFEHKIWLSSPTMHGPELRFMTEAYETNWMSTVGANINEVERLACEKIGCGHAVALPGVPYKCASTTTRTLG